ncbi:copper homeostasis membrane protein CopD [Dyella amyloliquefaciens]|uniref:copper homeostasis membrane protein CopD n=1 Tax=Dyella amyloliquefaciens TaxID=1770545 RepID=UPI00197A9BEE|nr:copper homeostasis membrane protein CopD [Dyella amyloliquefaciens]
MFDGLLVLSRFALYIGLMLAYGVPLFVLQVMGINTLASPVVRRAMRVAAAATLVGLLASATALWAMAQSMSATSDPGAVWSVVRTLLTQTTVGMTWNLRVALLVVCLWLGVVTGIQARIRVAALSVLGAVALATLAWAGHGAMNDGAVGWLHLAADIAHLLVAGAWVGALVSLTLIAGTASRQGGREAVVLLSSAATGFARMGTLIVAVLIVTGAVNYTLIVGPTLSGLVEAPYGRLLLIKLGLFASMLALAATNRFHLAPALSKAEHDADVAGAVSALKRSIYLETTLVISILGLVAWLGTLNPGGG